MVRRARFADLIDTAPVVAMDANGLGTRPISAHFGHKQSKGKGHRQRVWPNLAAMLHTHSHLLPGTVPGLGPGQDSPGFIPAKRQAAGLPAIDTAPGEAGYAAEHNHTCAAKTSASGRP